MNTVVEIIESCPLKCNSCLAHKSSDMTGMSLDDIKKILEIPAIKHISLSGGEPFLHPKLLDIVELVNKRGIKPDIFTSGMIIPKNLKEFAGKVNMLRVSIKYGVDAPENIWRGVEGSFSKTKKFLQACTKHEIDLAAHHVLDKNNTGVESGLNYVPDMLNIDEKYNILPIFIPFIAYEEKDRPIMLSKNQWRRISDDLQERGYFVEMVEDKCTAGFGRCCISQKGEIRGCIYYPYWSNVGNILKDDDWFTISKKLENQRLDMEYPPIPNNPVDKFLSLFSRDGWPCGHCPVFEDAARNKLQVLK